MDPKDIKEIKAFIDLMKKNDLSVFEIEKDGFRLKLQKDTTDQATVQGDNTGIRGIVKSGFGAGGPPAGSRATA